MKAAPKWMAASICGYEVLAIASGRVPTVTALCGRFRWLGPTLVVALTVHLYRAGPPAVKRAVTDDCFLCPGWE
jgi:hypothetical protein